VALILTAEISNGSAHWSVNLYLPNATDMIDESCDDINTNCCSVNYCDRTIIRQVDYYINRKNLER